MRRRATTGSKRSLREPPKNTSSGADRRLSRTRFALRRSSDLSVSDAGYGGYVAATAGDATATGVVAGSGEAAARLSEAAAQAAPRAAVAARTATSVRKMFGLMPAGPSIDDSNGPRATLRTARPAASIQPGLTRPSGW